MQDWVAAEWADVERFYASVGCELKDLATICELAHYSLEELRPARRALQGVRLPLVRLQVQANLSKRRR
jgi:hypothetical protein